MSRHPGKRLSPWRVTFGILIVLGAVASAIGIPWYMAQNAPTTQVTAGPRWFGGYFDVTAAPSSTTPSGTDTVVLAFVVAAKSDSCTPSWGAAYSLADAGRSLDLDRRIDRMRRDGAHVAVSFGGAQNTELASACTNVDELEKAYSSVIDRYGIATIDLDLEHSNLSDTAAAVRRAEAVAELQRQRRGQGKPLDVWVTLPTATSGLTAEGVEAVRALLAGGVDLAGVNVMTMDYGTDLGRRSMSDVSIAALQAVHDQLTAVYRDARIALPADGAWAVMGATPMIGQNDVTAEVFTLNDAKALSSFAQQKRMARLSMWSLNRDRTCGPNYPDVSVVSDACSGVAQNGTSFAALLSPGFTGTPDTSTPTRQPVAPVPDDPATAPYPIWSPDRAYSAGVRVVWHGYVYAAKWWVHGGPDPDDPRPSADQTAWSLVGPVLPDDQPFALPKAPPGTYPDWDAQQTYAKGARVLFAGTPYQAKWWTQGDVPSEGITDHDRSPWQVVDDATK